MSINFLNLFGIGNWFNRLGDTIIYAIIAIAAAFVLVKLLQHEHSRKLAYYALAAIIIGTGILSGIGLFKELKATSYVRGSIDVRNSFTMESFYHKSNSIVFYEDLYENIHYYDIDLLKVDDFNGQEKDYYIRLNSHILQNLEVNAGAILGTFELEFLDTQGQVIVGPVLEVRITFYSNRTNLYLKTTGAEEAAYLQQYFFDNSFYLEARETIGGNNNEII